MTRINIKDISEYIPQFLGGSYYKEYLSPRIIDSNGYLIDFTGCKYLGWGFMRDLYIINKYRGGLVVTGLEEEALRILLKFWNSMRDGKSHKSENITRIDRSNFTTGIFD